MLKRFLAMTLLLCLTLFGVPSVTEAADARTIIANEIAAGNSDPAQIEWLTQAILYASSLYGVDPLLVAAIMKNESGFDIGVENSSAGAIGLMQLMPDTAATVGVNPYDPLQNVIGGAACLRLMLDAFADGSEYGVAYAIAAYNAGPNAVRKYGGCPPFRETIAYVNNVAASYNGMLAQYG